MIARAPLTSRGVLTELLWHVHNDDVRALVVTSRTVHTLLQCDMSAGGGYWRMLLKGRFPLVPSEQPATIVAAAATTSATSEHTDDGRARPLYDDATYLRLFAWARPANCIEMVSAGNEHHSVAVLPDGRVRAWGLEFSMGKITDAAFAVPIGRRCVQVSAGSFFSLALLDDGSVVAWPSAAPRFVPRVPAGRRCVHVSAGASHSLVVLDDGCVVGWGNDGYDAAVSGAAQAVPAGRRCVQVSAGLGQSVALLDDGRVVEWGTDYSGFDDISRTNGIARAIPADRRCVQISAGWTHSLALLDDGRVVGWGRDNHGQASGAARAVPLGRRCVQLSAGMTHSLALLDDGRVVGWGYDSDGQVSGAACAVPNGRRCVQVSAGGDHSLALLDNGCVVAWGDQHRRSRAWCNSEAPPGNYVVRR